MGKRAVFTCDRCGKEKRTNPSCQLPKTWRQVIVEKASKSSLQDKFITKSRDLLCGACKERFNKFMKGEVSE